ncbi:hypothetical protein M1523_03035 [Patescibacteria group bacterium]|nr:hypothetical protein [Patescibacteria group bacterium]MCL5091304.1 hypothetical protein [Patescibacteria group bacterium]
MADDSKPIIVAVICIIASAFISGVVVYNRIHTYRQGYSDTQLTPSVPPHAASPTLGNPMPTAAITIPAAGGPQSQAKTVLESFFTLANKGDYEKAANLLGWDNMETADLNQWPGPTYAKTLENYCKAVGTCLKIKNAAGEKISDDKYRFAVSFQNNDGSDFVINPPSGMAGVPTTTFIFTVKKINGVFKLLTPPIFRS